MTFCAGQLWAESAAVQTAIAQAGAGYTAAGYGAVRKNRPRSVLFICIGNRDFGRPVTGQNKHLAPVAGHPLAEEKEIQQKFAFQRMKAQNPEILFQNERNNFDPEKE